MTLCSACAPPGGGRNPVTPRMVRHFAMMAIPAANENTLKTIFKVSRRLRLFSTPPPPPPPTHTHTHTHFKFSIFSFILRVIMVECVMLRSNV